MTSPPDGKRSKDDEAEAWARMEAAVLELRRQEFRRTTPGERIEEAFELNEFANELREGVLKARR